MINPLKYLLRLFALERHGSGERQCIIPLEEVRAAAVFIDAAQPGADAAEVSVRDFFDSRNVELTVLKPSGPQLNYAGYMKRKFRMPGGSARHEDLFISLSDNPGDFAAEFESRCSPARFKVGRVQLSGEIFDMVVSPRGDERAGQDAVFGAISEYLLKIK